MENHPRHTNIQYEAELDALRERLQTVGVMVEQQIVRAVESLVDRNSELVEDQKAPQKHLHLVHRSHKPKSKTAVQLIITHLSGINLAD